MAVKKKKTYTSVRPYLPADIKRGAAVEANHRCLICKEPTDTPEYHHIDYNRENNTLENIAFLCANCHRRAGKNKTITIKDLLEYKRKANEENRLRNEAIANKEQIKNLQRQLHELGKAVMSKRTNHALYNNLHKQTRILFDKTIQYHILIYLLSPFYIDQRSVKIRAMIRKLLKLQKKDETYIIKALIQNGLVTKEGNLLFAQKTRDLTAVINDLINEGTINPEELINLFILQ